MALLLLAPFGTALSGQTAEATGSISGRVQNAATNRYLTNARVEVLGSEQFTFTNNRGEFTLGDLPAGSATIEVFYTGLNTETLEADVTAGEVTDLSIELRPRAAVLEPEEGEDDAAFELAEFSVVAQRDLAANSLAINEQRFSPNLKNVVSTDAFGDVAQGNIGEFLKHIPGVTIEYEGNTAQGVQLRGFASNFTNVTIDGGQMASAASNSTQHHSRTFGLDQTSINNISRIEVTKLPTPADPANSLGGSVNLVTKSAFERSDAQLDYSVYVSANSEAMDLEKTPGPAENESHKIRPSFNLTYTLPVNESFGLVLTAASDNQYTLRRQNVAESIRWGEDDSGVDAYAAGYRTSQNQQTTRRNSAGIKMDWKPFENHIISASFYGNKFDGFSASRSLQFRANDASEWGEGFVHGESANGFIHQGGTFQDRESTNQTYNLRYTYYANDWEVEAAVNRSESENSYKDLDKGFFRNFNSRISNVRVDLDDIDHSNLSVGSISAETEDGEVVDITAGDNFLLRGDLQGNPYDSEDVIEEARARVKRSFTDLPFRPSIELGASVNDFSRRIDTTRDVYTFVGADGIAETADDNLSAFADPLYSGKSLGFGYPGFQYASPWLLHDAFISNPEYFRQTDENIHDAIEYEALRSVTLNEKITAYYATLEGWFFDSKLRLMGGVRYEKTEDEGLGMREIGSIYDELPENEESARLKFHKRGASYGGSYDGIYPSLHGTYYITDNLLLRMAYAKTIGRPAIHHIVPTFWVGENIWSDDPDAAIGWVDASNPELEPWEADNYDVSLEYYLENIGVISVGVFRKDITDFFGTYEAIVDEALMEELGLTENELGYTYQTDINAGDAKIQGIEMSFQGPLGFLGPWGEPFELILNYTRLNLDGDNEGDFEDFIPETGNLGLKYTKNRWLVFAKWNYRGEQRREFVEEPVNGAEYIKSRLELDINVEFQINDWASIFVSGRNVTNEAYEWERYNDAVPGYMRLTSHSKYGAQYTLGFKGSF